jgi:hypothetical protein
LNEAFIESGSPTPETIEAKPPSNQGTSDPIEAKPSSKHDISAPKMVEAKVPLEQGVSQSFSKIFSETGKKNLTGVFRHLPGSAASRKRSNFALT